jgi:hypothetical protein
LEKLSHLEKVLKNLTNHSNFNESFYNSRIASSNSFYNEISSIKYQNNSDYLNCRKFSLHDDEEKKYNEYIIELQKTTILKNKIMEITNSLLKKRKKIEELLYLKRISEKKLANLDIVKFKAFETYVGF